jgi:hypothetical protein
MSGKYASDTAAVKDGPDLATLAETVRQQHQAVIQAALGALDHAMSAGDALAVAKSQIGHGSWAHWLHQKCEIPERTARRYMQLASARNLFEANRSRATDLTIAGALRLLGNKKSAPGKNSGKRPQALLSPLAWTGASVNQRRLFLIAIGLPSLLEALPFPWAAQLSRHAAKVKTKDLDDKIAKCLRLALAQSQNAIAPEAVNALVTLNNIIIAGGHDLHEIVGLKFDRSQTIERRARARAA